MEIQNAWVVITGASRGIGVTIAEAFAQRGANLVLVARSREGLEKTRVHLERFGGLVRLVPFDLQDITRLERLAEEIGQAAPRVDILVNNAGLEKYCHFAACRREDILSILSVNLMAPMELTRLLLPGMLDRGKGHIVNISSLGGKVAEIYNSLYAASKGGLDLWSDALRQELDGTGVTVSLVNPGYVTDSGMIHNIGLGTAFISGSCRAGAVAEAVVRCVEKNRRQVFVNSVPVRPMIITGLLFPRILDLMVRWGGVARLNHAKVEKRMKADTEKLEK